MTEQPPGPRKRSSIPRQAIPWVVLGLFGLLMADLLLFKTMFGKGPGQVALAATAPNPAAAANPLPEPSNPAATQPPVETPGPGFAGLAPAALATETPGLTGVPLPAPFSSPAPRPSYDTCQYTLQHGPRDFLYAIYWQWGVYKQLPDLNDFYTHIRCAGLPGNSGCSYNSEDPDTTQPGWSLLLPGVAEHTCLAHGGTPMP